MLQASRKQLLYLGALGVWGLWGHAYYNGMFDRLDTITTTLIFPDGRPLRPSYTGISPLDAQLSLLVAFYDVLTNSLTSGPRLLFFDINYTVACANLWTLIESRRGGVRSWWLKYPAWAMTLCNVNGAAIILPLYMYFLCRSKGWLRDPSISPHEAAALPVTTLVILLQPLLLFVPAWIGASSSEIHHVCIAVFQIAPFAVLGIFLSLASMFPRATSASSGSCRDSKRWVVASLILCGTVASFVHMFTVVGALRTTDSDASFTRIFVPAWGFSDPMKELGAGGGPSVEYAALLENFHLFSQWDWIILTLASVLYAHLLLSRRQGLKLNMHMSSHEAQELAYLGAATIILGPGGAVSFALAIREGRIW
ncbi:hypothetical protein FGRMN_8167 [Fusarium graminum]|nr:hypothetical protein FGRMN_8167 [Fusarium graminum]